MKHVNWRVRHYSKYWKKKFGKSMLCRTRRVLSDAFRLLFQKQEKQEFVFYHTLREKLSLFQFINEKKKKKKTGRNSPLLFYLFIYFFFNNQGLLVVCLICITMLFLFIPLNIKVRNNQYSKS